MSSPITAAVRNRYALTTCMEGKTMVEHEETVMKSFTDAERTKHGGSEG